MPKVFDFYKSENINIPECEFVLPKVILNLLMPLPLTDCLLSTTAFLHPLANLTLVLYHLQCSPPSSYTLLPTI